jgi:MFS transporter, DHA1 family, multidrug resistance protein
LRGTTSGLLGFSQAAATAWLIARMSRLNAALPLTHSLSVMIGACLLLAVVSTLVFRAASRDG